MKTTLVIFIIFFLNQSVNAQSIHSSWYCKDYDTWFCIRKKGYSSIDWHERIKIKKVKNMLKITEIYNPSSIFNRKFVSWFSIEKLTTDTLIISCITSKGSLTEINFDKPLKFIKVRINDECSPKSPLK